MHIVTTLKLHGMEIDQTLPDACFECKIFPETSRKSRIPCLTVSSPPMSLSMAHASQKLDFCFGAGLRQNTFCPVNKEAFKGSS
jgi:hypothetical protein